MLKQQLEKPRVSTEIGWSTPAGFRYPSAAPAGVNFTCCGAQDYGEVAEWSKAAVLKTVEGQPSVGSNPTFSAIQSCLCWASLPGATNSRKIQAGTPYRLTSFAQKSGLVSHKSAPEPPMFSNADLGSPGLANQDVKPSTFRCSFQSSGKPFFRRARESVDGISPRMMASMISGASQARLSSRAIWH